MAEPPVFQRKQFAFAAHIRDPDTIPPPPGIEDRRMAVYRELFFNNLSKLLGSTFPVLKKLHAPDRWRRLVRAFMARHRAHTPYFLEIPREFLNFLEKEYEPDDADMPFLVELAHYEWLELALSVSPEENDLELVDTDGDLLQGVPVRSRLACAHTYRYAVHRISPDYQPREPGGETTHLVVYRKADGELGFMEQNPISARLLELVGANDAGSSGRALLERLAAEIGWQDIDSFLRHGAAALEAMRAAEIVIGTRKAA